MSIASLPHTASRRPAADADGRIRGIARTLLRGRSEEAPWARLALIALLAGTAVAYLWNLTASGDANGFYAAAVEAATRSWKAFFFGSLDSSSFITVDKPPASLWIMALSGRAFGFSSASMLVPQAMEGLLAVGLLHATVKRWFGPGAGLLAALSLALTPVAALMFRFNNPDALLVCLLVAAAYCLIRALEGASTRWLVAVGVLVGFAFLAKMMQAFLVLPAFGLVYLLAAPTGLRRRLGALCAGAAALLVTAGWWVAVVALWPAASRPMIDGSPNNSIINLIFGYNGLGRIFGAGAPAGGSLGGAGGGPAGGGPNFSGPAGLLRLFDNLMGGQASWLLPAALVTLGIGLWMRRGRPRTDRVRAAFLIWGGWLVISGLVFSLASGVIHTYYTVALAPAIAALVAMGVSVLWRARAAMWSRIAVASVVGLTAAWSWDLLDRTPAWMPWLRLLIVLAGATAIVCIVAGPALARALPRGGAIGALLAAIACLAGPAAYAAQTIATPHTGSVPSAGPGSQTGSGPGPGGRTQQGAGSALVKALEHDSARYRWVTAVSGSQTAASIELATGGEPVMAIGGFDGQGGNLTLAQFKLYVAKREIHYYIAGAGGLGAGGSFGMGDGGLPGRGAPGGGFPAGGPGRGFPAGGLPAGGGPGRSASGSAIAQWVEAHFKRETIGGQTVYVLSGASRG